MKLRRTSTWLHFQWNSELLILFCLFIIRYDSSKLNVAGGKLNGLNVISARSGESCRGMPFCHQHGLVWITCGTWAGPGDYVLPFFTFWQMDFMNFLVSFYWVVKYDVDMTICFIPGFPVNIDIYTFNGFAYF